MFTHSSPSGPFTPDAVIWLVLILGLPVVSLLVLLTFLVRLASRRLGSSRFATNAWIERKWLLWTSAGFLVTYGVALLYAHFIETKWVELTKTELRVRTSVLGRDRFRIVQLSDLHLDRDHIGGLEHRVVDLVREAKPDLILLTGDYGNSSKTPGLIVEMLRGLEAPYGKYAVMGNNDLNPNRIPALISAGVVPLRNEVKIIEEKGNRLRLVGQEYYFPHPLHAMLGEEKGDPYTIFLAHTPDAVDDLESLKPGQRVDLFLCGHTHGGQVCLPLWGAVVTESKYHKKYERGLFDVRGVPMYVNRGIGAVDLPVRFLARPEVAVIDLVSP